MKAEERRIRVSRSARYFISSEQREETWFVLHGYGQLASTFIAEFASFVDRARLVAPEALSRFYPNHPKLDVGASWMTREDRELEIADYVGYLDAIYREVVDSGTVRVLGFSQGGATAARWFARGASRIDHLILWGCAFPPDIDLTAARERLTRTKIHSVVGETDRFVSGDELRDQTRRFEEASIALPLVRFAGGHRIDLATLTSLTS